MVPIVIESDGRMERSYDIYSRLLKDRIVIIGQPISDALANVIVAQLLFLDSQDPGKEIQIYINCPGGSIDAGFAILDTMRHIRSPVSTYCVGHANSFGTVILMSGENDRRFSLPHSRIHIHQPLIYGGISGQATEIDIHAREILRARETLEKYMSQCTGQPVEKIHQDCDRDLFMSAEEAVEYGIIDKVLYPEPKDYEKKQSEKNKKEKKDKE